MFEKTILLKISPTESENRKIELAIKEITNKIKNILKSESLEATIDSVGSYSKNTNLQKGDCDLFIISSSEQLPLIRKALFSFCPSLLDEQTQMKVKIPYLKGVFNNINFDVVPCVNPNEEISDVSRTPLHKKYVIENLISHDDVRLLKQFMKISGVYGADSKVCGFSGYLCECLIIKYGSFENTIKEIATNWDRNYIISKTNKILSDDFLIMADPVDRNRNIAGSAGSESCIKLIFKAREFLSKPSNHFFFERALDIPTKELLNRWKNRGTYSVILGLDVYGNQEDMYYSQLRKINTKINAIFREKGQIIYESSYYCSSHKGYLLLEFPGKNIIPKKIYSPDINKNIMEYKIPQHKIYTEGNKFYFWKLSQWKTIKEFLSHILNNKTIFKKRISIMDINKIPTQDLKNLILPIYFNF